MLLWSTDLAADDAVEEEEEEEAAVEGRELRLVEAVAGREDGSAAQDLRTPVATCVQ